MNHDAKIRAQATTRLALELAKPLEATARADGTVHCDDEFDPWSLFPALYGTYSSDFDECALAVLAELRDKEKVREDLGAEMFREMLCTGGFCRYGTSPRVCFWDLEDDLLSLLIERWAGWSERYWSDTQ